MFKKLSLAVAIASTLLTAHVQAAEINISKLRINMQSNQLSDFVELTNSEKVEKTGFEVEIKKWTQKQNADNTIENIYEDTKSIIISPKTFVILPEKSKNIRLLINDPKTTKQEYSYRLFAKQLPKPAAPDGGNSTSISMLFAVSIPVFHYSEAIKTTDKMNLETSIITENNKKFLKISNKDNQHIQLFNVLDSAETKSMLNKEKDSLSFPTKFSATYILPGSTLKIELNSSETKQDFSTFTILADKGNKTVEAK